MSSTFSALPLSRATSALRRAAALLACAAALPTAQAGPSLSQALARHEQQLERDADAQGGWAPTLPTPPDGLVLAGGNPLRRQPQLVASPLGYGGSGARLLQTLEESRDGSAVRLGVQYSNGAQRRWTPEGSELTLRAGVGQAYASYQRRHWGPGWSGSLILDAAAPALPAIGWRKTANTPFDSRWLSWLGPWNADVFFGALGGHDEPSHPLFTGLRLQVQPLPSLQLGVSRTLQWAGSGRSMSLKTLAKGLAGQGDQSDVADQDGHRLGSLDARWRRNLAGGHQVALYGQTAGGSRGGLLPAKNMKMAGAEWALQRSGRSLRVFVERADTVAGQPGLAYRPRNYAQGYTMDGQPLGYPAGGDVRLTSVGALLTQGRLSGELVAYRGTALATAQNLASGNIDGINASLAWSPFIDQAVGLSLWSGRDGAGRQHTGQLWWQRTWR